MAKFKDGDKVVVTSGIYEGAKATIEDVITPRKIYATVHYGGNNLTVEFEENDLRAANSCAINSTRAIVQKALNATACNIGDNPNYKPKEGMKFLASHFDIFDIKKAKEMIDDAKKKGVKIPDEVIAKAKKVGIWNSTTCNGGMAMISRTGSSWYYKWADGAKEGEEGPFKTAEEAEVAAKQDGFKIANSTSYNAEYIIRKAFTYGKWLLEKKASSLGDKGDIKVFSSEAEAVDYAKKNGLRIANSTSCNAKFKVGDKVKVDGRETWGIATIKEISDGSDICVVKFPVGSDCKVLKKNLITANSCVAKNAEIMDVASDISRALGEAWDAITRCRQIVEQKANKITTSDKAIVMKDVATLRKMADRIDTLSNEYSI